MYEKHEMKVVEFSETDAIVNCFSENEGDIYDEFGLKPERSDI